jgi:predicted RNase H-like HicB family nuclease
LASGAIRKMKEYAVVYERGERNWSAYVPDLPGCVATGASLEETEKTITEAIEFHIEGMLSHGEVVPPPTSYAGTVRVSA